jgi:hypothetical protein
MTITALDAVRKFKSYVGVKRAQLPWLRGRQYLYDCAAAYSWIAGLHPEFTRCTEMKDYCVKKGTWTIDPTKAKQGDAVMFDWEHKGAGLGHNTNTDHVGMVISIDLKKHTVKYVSADSTNPTPGLVTVNTISLAWVTGFGRPVDFADPAQPTPVHPVSSAIHNNPTNPIAAVTPPTFGIGGQPLR